MGVRAEIPYANPPPLMIGTIEYLNDTPLDNTKALVSTCSTAVSARTSTARNSSGRGRAWMRSTHKLKGFLSSSTELARWFILRVFEMFQRSVSRCSERYTALWQSERSGGVQSGSHVQAHISGSFYSQPIWARSAVVGRAVRVCSRSS